MQLDIFSVLNTEVPEVPKIVPIPEKIIEPVIDLLQDSEESIEEVEEEEVVTDFDAIEPDAEEEEEVEYYIQERSKSRIKKTPLPKHPPKDWDEFCRDWRMFIKRIINQHKIFGESEKDLLNIITLEFLERRDVEYEIVLPQEQLIKIQKHPINIYMSYNIEECTLIMNQKIEAHDLEEIKFWFDDSELSLVLDKMFFKSRPYFDKFDANKGKFQSFLYSFVSKRSMRQWTRENKDKVRHAVKLAEECDEGAVVFSTDELIEETSLRKKQLDKALEKIKTVGRRNIYVSGNRIIERSLYSIFQMLQMGFSPKEISEELGVHENYIHSQIKVLRTIPEIILLKSMVY